MHTHPGNAMSCACQEHGEPKVSELPPVPSQTNTGQDDSGNTDRTWAHRGHPVGGAPVLRVPEVVLSVAVHNPS